MRLDKLAQDYVRRAKSRMIDANAAYNRTDYPEVVRYCQEAVELSLKACLRIVGIEYPKDHHVGPVLKRNKEKFPAWFREWVEQLDRISAELAEKRAPSMYGIELLGKGPSEIFKERDAAEARRDASLVLEKAEKLISELTEKR